MQQKKLCCDENSENVYFLQKQNMYRKHTYKSMLENLNLQMMFLVHEVTTINSLCPNDVIRH